MKRNVGSWDRWIRAGAGVAMLVCSVMAPFSLTIRALALGAPGVYMLFTALAGTCFGYRLMGRSTCPVSASRDAA